MIAIPPAKNLREKKSDDTPHHPSSKRCHDQLHYKRPPNLRFIKRTATSSMQ